MVAASGVDPFEYISKACEIHLGSSPGKDAVEIFIGKSECLFVWTDPSSGLAMVGDALPGKYRGAVAFLGGGMADDEGEARKPMQCVTLQPSMLAVEDTSGSEDEDDLMASSQATLLQAMQLYTRHLFLPAVKQGKGTNVLQDKIRELDVAIGQSQRSARLPHVQLQVNPVIEQVASSLKSTNNIDWQSLGLAEKLTDDDFLNGLQSGVSQWIAQIRKITVLPKTTPFPMIAEDTSADLEEIAFWNQLHQELTGIQQQLSSPGVEVTVALLREAKRFVATLALENNTGLEQAVGVTQDIEHFLKSYPVMDFQAARDFDKISLATNAIFDHLPKIRQSRYYSLERSAQLLEATTFTLRRAIEHVIREQFNSFLFMDYKEYQNKLRFPVQDVFVQFEDRWDQFKEFFLEQARRRKLPSPAKILDQIVLYHKPLAERLDQVDDFRANHEKLREVVHQVLEGDDEEKGAIQLVDSAPRLIFSSLDLLDLSPGGRKALESSLEEYDLQMDAMEERLAKLLRDKLTACQDAEDMFRVFARFNPLLTRTRVRVAVKEFQVQLIATVADAVQKLQSKFTLKYESSSAARIAKLRGIPQISGKILWAKQMERQVNALMDRMGNVLGPGWGQQIEGRQLRKSGDELLAKLDARSFFRAWITEWEKELTAQASGRLHSYPVVVEINSENELFARVNFDEKAEILSKEIRHLKWLGFEKDVPKTLTIVSDEAVQRYPFAIAIKTSLRSYQAVRGLIGADLEPLVMPQLLDVREIISETFDVKLETSNAIAKKRRIRWDSPNLSDWVTRLSDSVTKLEERVEQLLQTCNKVETDMRKLESVDYDSEKFREVLESIQQSIDEMSMSGYSGLKVWVETVEERLASVLTARLKDALECWARDFDARDEEKEVEIARESLPKLKVAPISVDIILRNQEISAVPSVPTTRSLFLNRLHAFIGVVCNLPRPNSSRFEVFDSNTDGKTGDQTFRYLVDMVPSEVLSMAYSVVEERMSAFTDFISQWLAYQTLWDTQVSDVSAKVGKDISKWQALLLESANARSALDLSATTAEFGPISVKYNKVQSQINLKYDAWQKELQSSFASVLSQCIHETHQKMESAKDRLEAASLESSSGTDNIVNGVTFIQEMKGLVEPWTEQISRLEASERLLKRQRYHFRADWMETSLLNGQFALVQQALARRVQTMDSTFPLLQSRVSAEEKAASKRAGELVNEWASGKPLRGNMAPSEALNLLAKFEFNLNKADKHQQNLVKAKDALGLDHTAESDIIAECLQEVRELKEVWEAVVKPYDELRDVKEMPWASAVLRKIRRSLDDLLAELRNLPNRIRQYDAYNHLHDEVKNYINGHGLMNDLKTEALKDRHWKTIMKRLSITGPFSELTVGSLWASGVLSRKKEINEILSVAQGEMALEVFLGQVRDRWMKQELDMVIFQNRVRLIRGWEDLFATLDDHMGGLALMKSSPFFRSVREFQEQNSLWSDRLTKLRAAFDAWIDVQRRWVYLEGILLGSSDIKAQLPAEWSRFKSVDSEFVSLQRRIAGRPYAMEVLNIENLQRTLERLGHLMNTIQRALGDYLEKQRRDFSRFYFLGDDDLLEIMGNSSEPGKVLPHVPKMFAGIAGAKQSYDDLPENAITRLDAMLSKDGEVVQFHNPIVVSQGGSVKEWLKAMENEMKNTLARLLEEAVSEDSSAGLASDDGKTVFVQWATKFPAQIMILATQVNWSMGVDAALNMEDSKAGLQNQLTSLEWKLSVMAETVLLKLPPQDRKKFEQMITELVHQRDVTRQLLDEDVSDPDDFRWLYHLRYNYNPQATNLAEKLQISLSNANFFYGFEYLGIGERLVQTPLTDKAYLTLTQALRFRMGGSPFGPAGTGKTETVKALGAQLGRFVLVFNCDETFDFSAMGRLFAGLCQVGAWGCFDEFNRLEERILSAVSQQILTIQKGLMEGSSHIDLLGRSVKLDPNMGTFITMNPGYAGRSNLPDNLKTLFRSVAMVIPDRKLIAQVMLYSQGIVTAEDLAPKIVDLFLHCDARMSSQRHYDFGLRALKTLLVSAGALKRRALEGKGELSGDALAEEEKNALIIGACNNVLPKLIAEDMTVFKDVLEDVFPGSSVSNMDDDNLKDQALAICKERGLVPDDRFVQKLLQLKQVVEMRHGVMVVGPSGSGKSTVLGVLLESMEKMDGKKGEMYTIDPKSVDKENLYGSLDGTTLEWTDGIFTALLRKIIDNQKGESERRHWIVFDGDVDPEWAENLNSVLDDNKMLTLPSGERLQVPPNVRIILEVDNLSYATPATVSRCGMVWFSEETVSVEMSLNYLLNTLRKEDASSDRSSNEDVPAAQINFLNCVQPLIVSEDGSSSLMSEALEFSLEATHVMDATRERLLLTFRALMMQGVEHAIGYDENHPDFPMVGEHMEKFAKRWLLHALVWSLAGSCSWDVRKSLGELLLRRSGVALPDNDKSLVDYRVRVEDGEYELWSSSVPRMEIESHRVSSSDVVITTTDTVRHTDILGAWLSSRMPLLLCGPPGSGKTMTLTSVLQSIQGVVLASLNFSSRTTPEIILKVFQQYCTFVRKGKDIVLEPSETLGTQSWLVVFCDEINLPEEDAYGTQRVIMFMRQLVEQGGFWRDDNVWIKINRIQFVGACNPPTDAGRVALSQRFLRHSPLLLVDFPERDSLIQIYQTFNGGMMKLFPNLKGETLPMTEAMVEVYTENQKRFSPSDQPQYFYSPRELSRWVRGIYEAVVNMDQGLVKEELVRIWAHEGIRLFADRLTKPSETRWCQDKIDEIAQKWFASVDFDEALKRPIFYTSWLSKETRKVERDELKNFLTARLRVFYEEELDVPIVVFDEVLDHILRIDRVLRQPMGHLLLAGDSGAGKTVLSRFVSWMNGLNIFQIKAHSRYDADDFFEDLRTVMKRVGCDGEKITFIFDESNVLSSGFLEAMNALLASGEVPGLFEGDEYNALMNACRDSAARDGVIVDSDEELWRRFTGIVQRNLHVVFTVNPSGGDWKNRSTTSPALFNRCVVDWFGTWSNKALGEVGKEFTLRLDLGDSEAVGGSWGIGDGESLMQRVAEVFEGSTGGLRQAVVAALVDLHNIAKEAAENAAGEASSITRTFLSPRDYLTLIHNFMSCLQRRREEVEDQQLHTNAGLDKLRQTQENVAELKQSLGEKTMVLREKEALANEKLQQMVADQNVAERRKTEAERMSADVKKQQVQIDTRKEEAQRDLDEAEPALRSAQASVRGIKKRDLDEVRALSRPPNNVKLTLECVAIMLGEKKTEWADVRKLLSKGDFIPSILNFDADKLSAKQIKQVRDNYLDGNPDLTVEAVMRSSRACGPLFQWAESQIKYSSVYNRIQPLRDEVEQLEGEARSVKEKLETVEAEVESLEASISQYKTDYAVLIRDVEALKAEMESVTTKVDRAESLLGSLGHESQRWQKSSDGFQAILKSLLGDGLLMAAFLTYSGFFDFKHRSLLLDRWKKTLDSLGIEFRNDLGLIESLSKASTRLHWQSEGLPGDQLSMENGVILDHAVRFPLVIDPSGHAITFIMNKHKANKIQKTSFLDKAFTKTLAGAVRFGTALLVENVEHIDPILNPLLNKELQRTGGRTIVRIGTEEVDFSPNFKIFLSTKNPAVQLTPDVCSRVTLINFSVTPASLQSQSLSQIVKIEKPELETQRASLLKLQGEQNVKLRELEDQMLAKISACEGSILEDDQVVAGMEVLMKEGSQVEEQIAQSDGVMAEVQRAVSRFEPLAVLCRKLFVTLGSLRDVSFLYEFSATTFMSIIGDVLEKNKGEGTEEERLNVLKKALFKEVAARVARGLSAEDKIVFSVLLARLFTDDRSIAAGENASSDDYISQFTVFGEDFPWQGRGLNDLLQVTDEELGPTVPLLLCSAPGHDVSGRVEAMAREAKKDLSSVAMGSAEGFEQADSIISTSSKRGNWVMLKNVHLCTDWLRENFVKKLQSLGQNTHPDFRIFITSEINPKLPTGLLRLCDVIVAEAPTGVRASMTRFFSSISRNRLENPFRNRLYLLLAWTHAVIQERLRYVPDGWSEKYEFTEADASHGLDVIDSLMNDMGGDRSGLDPEKLPWDAIRSTLQKGVFGGRVTQMADQEALDKLVGTVFIPQAYDLNFKLIPAISESPLLPEGTSKSECIEWIASLPGHTPPTWLGLDPNAEEELEARQAKSIKSKIVRLSGDE